ncbi:hypothetical protein AWR38_28100 [Idiomarina sp. WRN-38]|nr:hypothetical protein AUR68_28060 [Idiomarina sp. H105]OAF07576.1 hypothetical protein AWR38_28100 [Idiomarina sp. WRN-38]
MQHQQAITRERHPTFLHQAALTMMRENQRMVTEKMEASIEAGLVVQKAFFSAMSGQYAPWWITSQKSDETLPSTQ